MTAAGSFDNFIVDDNILILFVTVFRNINKILFFLLNTSKYTFNLENIKSAPIYSLFHKFYNIFQNSTVLSWIILHYDGVFCAHCAQKRHSTNQIFYRHFTARAYLIFLAVIINPFPPISIFQELDSSSQYFFLPLFPLIKVKILITRAIGARKS